MSAYDYRDTFKFLKDNKNLIRDCNFYQLGKKIDNYHTQDVFLNILWVLKINPLLYMTKIPDYYFYMQDSPINKFEIPNNIEIIGESSFQTFFLVKEIIIPSSVKEIHTDAFSENDANMSIIILSKDVKYIEDHVGSIFESCKKLTIKCYENSSTDIYISNLMHEYSKNEIGTEFTLEYI